MKNIRKIDDLQSTKARNYLRGMISNPAPADMLQLLRKIRDTCSESDFKIALEVIRESAIFTKNPIGRDLNKSFPNVLSGNVHYRPEEIRIKIEQNSKKLLQIASLAISAIEALAEYDPEKALRHCAQIVEHDGASIFLLKVLHYVRNHFSDDVTTIREVDRILADIKTNNVHYLSLVIKELTSSKTDYFNICDKINASEDGPLIHIAKSFIDHLPRSPEIFANTLGSYYGISLFDAYMYYNGAGRASLPFVGSLSGPLLTEYERLCAIDFDPEYYYDTSDEYVGLEFFRDAFLLVDLYCFFRYRTVHGAVFNQFEEKTVRRIPLERALLKDHFANIGHISTIGGANSSYYICTQKYVNTKACLFENSSALVFALERNEGSINDEEIEFVRLMSETRDIGIICPIHHIENIRINANTDELKLVATCLSYIKQKSQLKEHELRAIIQEVAIRRYGAKLTTLLDEMYIISPAVTEHLVQTVDETFLSKLFQLVRNPNRAIEERAEIFEWYSAKVNDLTYLERAKNLRIDVQISREKGTIDDSRIYVDPVKFTQWINDQVISSITILLDTLPRTAEAGLVALNWDKVKSGISAYDQVGTILLRCYEEFCSNKIYGIASYLGRRIRHGTLKGTGLNNVTSFATEPKYRKLFLVKEFDDAYRDWLQKYEEALDDLRDRHLHIQHRNKSDGMISTDFRSINSRVAANRMLHDVIKSFEINKNGLELPYIITEYCWRVIEEDLANIRKFLMEIKAKRAVFRFESTGDANLRQREVQEFCQDLNSVIAERFRTISSWFNKPSIASPSADIVLLFKAVVSEIKGFFPGYSPFVIVDENDFRISGGQYFVIYDALYILIYNAAKYGKRDGLLSMSVAFQDIADRMNIHITITSEVAPNETIHAVEESINLALQGDCEDALVMEGRSGIKKLRRMEQGNNIGQVAYKFSYDTVIASFNFAVDY